MVLQKFSVNLYSMEPPENSTKSLHLSDFDKQKSDNQFLTQFIQELKWESEHKDKIIDDLQAIISNLKSRLRANNLDDDVRLCEEELKQDTPSYQNIKGLLEKVKLAEGIKASVRNAEYLEKLIKDNEFYKNRISDLQIRLYSNTPTNNSFQKIEFMNLQHDVQQFSQQCQQMTQKLMAYEKNTFPPSNDFSVIEENKRLRNKIIEVQQANKKWRVYNDHRESFVRTLVAKLNTSQKETSDNSSHHKHLQNNYDDMNKHEEELLALKTQVKIYAEDFESERKDREKAQSRISDLESEILKLKHLSGPLQDQPNLGSYHHLKTSRYFDQKEPISRGLSESHYVNQAYQKDSIEPIRKRAETDSVLNTKQNFICPSCNMVFDSDKQTELLAHVDLCF